MSYIIYSILNKSDYVWYFSQVRTRTDLGDIRLQYEQLQQHNTAERHRLDDVFVQRSDIETRARDLETELEQLQQTAELKLHALVY